MALIDYKAYKKEEENGYQLSVKVNDYITKVNEFSSKLL
jgi:hypothetical protein